MATLSKVKLSGKSINNTKARIVVSWRTAFTRNEILSSTVFMFEVFLQNEDGLGDLDVRRRRIARGTYPASNGPVDKEIAAEVERSFLDEDFTVLGIGDRTDEWHADVILTPFVATKATGRSNTLREEFGWG